MLAFGVFRFCGVRYGSAKWRDPLNVVLGISQWNNITELLNMSLMDSLTHMTITATFKRPQVWGFRVWVACWRGPCDPRSITKAQVKKHRHTTILSYFSYRQLSDSGEYECCYADIDDYMQYETPSNPNRPLPSLPDSSSPKYENTADELAPDDVPYYVPVIETWAIFQSYLVSMWYIIFLIFLYII